MTRERGPGQDEGEPQEAEGKAGPDEREPGSGPISVRDLMRPATPEPEGEGEPRWEGDERAFDMDGKAWTVRTAGAGTYGTGGLGTARLLAVHFFREEAPETPVREALVPAGVFPTLRDEELRSLFESATPIDSLD